jgi:alanine racemase
VSDQLDPSGETLPPTDGELLDRPRLTIDLAALVANYQTILDMVGATGGGVAGVVKADGYGLGVTVVGPALWGAGCRRFFVARLDEGIELRSVLPEAEIFVFDGVLPGTVPDFVANRLTPVLNSLGQIAGWNDAAAAGSEARAAALHLDTGMLRLGLPPDEVDKLADDPSALAAVDVGLVLSHLASADVENHPQSAEQLAAFIKLRQRFPMGQASLANSAGCFLGPDYRFDLVRPGISLYGGSPFPDSGRPNPMAQVVTMEAPIIQVRSGETGQTVGYGATYQVEGSTRIATVPVGYADGFLRSSSNTGAAVVGGKTVPIVGRISMDLITIDVTGVDDRWLQPGMAVQLMGPALTVDEVAARAGSIPYEFLTNMGRRFARRTLPVAQSDRPG